MKKLTNMLAIAALSAVGAAPALAQNANDPFVSSQDEEGVVIDPATGLVLTGTALAFFLALSDSDSSSSSTTTTP